MNPRDDQGSEQRWPAEQWPGQAAQGAYPQWQYQQPGYPPQDPRYYPQQPYPAQVPPQVHQGASLGWGAPSNGSGFFLDDFISDEESGETYHAPSLEEQGISADQDLPIQPEDRPAFDAFLRAVQEYLINHNMAERIEQSLPEEEYAEVRRQVVVVAQQLLVDHFPAVTRYSPDVIRAVIEMVADYICGYGPIQGLLNDPECTEIIVRWTEPVLVERKGRLETTKLRFVTEDQLLTIMRRVARQVNREISEAEPILNAWLLDGSRVNMVIRPICPHGPIFTVRKFSDRFFHLADLVERGSLDEDAAAFLKTCVEAKTNIVVSGGTGSGKTALVRALAFEIPEHEYVVTIEDIWELRLEKERARVTPLVRRQAGSSGRGEVSLRDLLVNALRMRPDRILVGEVRGAEALEMLQAASTGHDGMLSTLHANTPQMALMQRLPMACVYSGDVDIHVAKMQTNVAVELIAQVTRDPDGYRHVSEIATVEVADDDAENAKINTVFRWDRQAKRLVQVGEPTGTCAWRLQALEEMRLAGSVPGTIVGTNVENR